MDFGLGLVLSFTDNATAGINNAVNSLGQLTTVAENASTSLNQMASLSAFSVVSGQLGDSLLNAGKGVMGMFSNLLGQTMSVGSSFEDFHITLDTMYGSAEKASEALNKLITFSAKTPFEVEDVKDLLVVLKSNGIEAFDSMKGSVTGLEQETLAWLGSLMAFKPDIPASRWRLAFTNFLGSGAPKVLENALDMGKIADTIGHDIGNTAQERMESLVEFIDKKDLGELMRNMMGTWSQVMSNMSDVWTMFLKKIADTGVFDKLKLVLMGITSAISDLSDSGKLDSVAKSIAEGLGIILNPLIKIGNAVGGFIAKLGDLADTHPKLVKLGVQLVAIAGILLTVTGIALKVASAFSGVSLMILAFGNSFNSIGGLLKSGALKIMGTLLPLTMAIGLLYLAWKNDFVGIRSMTTNFVNGVINSFNTARNSVNSSVGDMVATMDKLNTKNDFFSNLTVGIMKFMVLFRALKEGWSDFTLSEDTFVKAKELGILPLIEAIFDLKYRFDNFKKGFIKGWTEVSNKVKEVLVGLAESFKGTQFEGFFNTLTTLFQKLSNNDPKAWEDLGNFVGEMSAKLVIAIPVIKLFDSVLGKVITTITALSGLAKISSIIGSIGSAFGGIGGKIASTLGKMFPSITSVLETGLRSAFGSSVEGLIPNIQIIFTGLQEAIVGSLTAIAGAVGAPVWAIVLAIVAVFSSIIVYAKTKGDEFKEKVLSMWTTVKEEGLAIWESLKEGFSRIWDNLQTAIQPVVDAFNNLKGKLVEVGTAVSQSSVFQSLVNHMSAIGEAIMDIVVPAFNGLVKIISTALQSVWNVVVTVFNSIVNIISSFLSGAMNIISGILDIIVGIFTGDFEKIKSGVVSIFGSIFNFIGTILTSIWNVIASVLSGFINIFVTSFKAIQTTVMGALKGVCTIINTWLNNALTLVKNIWNSITGVISSALGKISSSVQSKFDGIRNTISNAIEGAKNIVKSGLDNIKSFFDSFSWSFPKLKLPHFSLSGSFSLDPPSVPSIGVDWYAKGGVFNSPTVIGVGEAGQEAVMPLENNTGWIGQLASMLATQLFTQFIPTNSSVTDTSDNETNNNQRYLTTNNTNTTSTVQGDTDNSITFSEGAIQVNIQNASEDEAIKFAKKVMEYIERQQELRGMLNYS